MSDPKAELAIKKLARLPANTICPQCGTEKKFGFSTICMKYKTFVCNMCKAGHTAISHRCKSLTMSSWTVTEVQSLTEAGGGGNDVARRTWLANAPPIGTGGRPREGDDVNVFKRFIVQVYEERRYWAEDTGAVAAAPMPAQPPVTAAAAAPRHRVVAPPKRAPARAPAPAAPALDLLDFGAFESAPPAPAPALVTAAPVPKPIANFGAFASAPAPAPSAPAPASAPAASSFSPNFDAFGGSDPFAAGAAGPAPAPPAAAAQSGFGFMSNNGQASAPAVAAVPTAPEPPKVKKPVMNMVRGSGNAGFSSNMGGNVGIGGMSGGGMNNPMMNNMGQMGHSNMVMNGGVNGGYGQSQQTMMNGGAVNNGGYGQQNQQMMMQQQRITQQQQMMGFGMQGAMQQGGYGNGMAQAPSTSGNVRDPFDSLFDGKK